MMRRVNDSSSAKRFAEEELFYWRKIDSNYHILYCKYNRLPIIIFPLIKTVTFLTSPPIFEEINLL